ncbi:MAG TPA: hypothetical protein VF665_24745 [Longimicrobium sp.]
MAGPGNEREGYLLVLTGVPVYLVWRRRPAPALAEGEPRPAV